MCIAILNQAGLISQEKLRNSWRSNPDGAGLLWVDRKGKLKTYKELSNFNRIYAKYREIKKQYGEDKKIVLHFRIGTSGRKNDINTHPFIVNHDLGFVHNGILSEFSYCTENKLFSDTYLFNEFLKVQIQSLINKKVIKAEDVSAELIKMLDKYIEPLSQGSKLLFLDSKENHAIINPELGTWEDNNWYSNTSYCSYGRTYYGSGWENDDIMDVYYENRYGRTYTRKTAKRTDDFPYASKFSAYWYKPNEISSYSSDKDGNEYFKIKGKMYKYSRRFGHWGKEEDWKGKRTYYYMSGSPLASDYLDKRFVELNSEYPANYKPVTDEEDVPDDTYEDALYCSECGDAILMTVAEMESGLCDSCQEDLIEWRKWERQQHKDTRCSECGDYFVDGECLTCKRDKEIEEAHKRAIENDKTAVENGKSWLEKLAGKQLPAAVGKAVERLKNDRQTTLAKEIADTLKGELPC